MRRDMAANPKKAIALALMVVVALYFWAPMLWGYVSPKKGKKSGNAAVNLILEDDPIEEGTQGGAKPKSSYPWDKVRKLAAADPRMKPASFRRSWTNPFRKEAPAPIAGTDDPAKAAAAELAQDIDPVKAGLKLTSIVMGEKTRSATISGKTYREGQMVPKRGKTPAEKSDTAAAAAGPQFELIKISRSRVELARNGKTYTLDMQRPELAQGEVTITRGGQ